MSAPPLPRVTVSIEDVRITNPAVGGLLEKLATEPVQTAPRKNSKVSVHHSNQIRILRQVCNYPLSELKRMFGRFGYKPSTIHEHSRKPIADDPVFDKRKLNKGRPKLLSRRDISALEIAVKRLRESEGTFCAATIQEEAGLPMINLRTCLLYTSPSPRDRSLSRMPSSA